VREHRFFAAIYDPMMKSLERTVLAGQREKLVAGLVGAVLDVGAGTGANLPYYQRATRVVAAEPDPAMRRRLSARAAEAPVPVEVSDAGGEALPFTDGEFDAVVFTLVLCTVADPARTLAEARRVLKPGGTLVVLEHVRGTGTLGKVQDRLTPLWKRVAAGCRLNRDTVSELERAGFDVADIRSFTPLPRFVPSRTMVEGTATRR
jgi:ubiquinone/menaquinone biosynthesis C-methylase UbiE